MNWYDLPKYYDVSFSHEMQDELRFLKSVFSGAAGKKPVRLLEPACGTGRLIVPLAGAGFDCTGFDVNKAALDYLKKKLQGRRLTANIFNADMADFAIQPAAFDGAFCTVDTFRHLLNENAAINHLRCVARHLKKQGVYVLGLHLLPDGGANNQFARWRHARGRLSVTTTMRVLNIDRRRREETIRMSLKIKTQRRNADYQSVYKLRTYTLRQFHQLLKRSGVFRIRACYDQDYDLTQAQTPDADSEDIVFLLEKTA